MNTINDIPYGHKEPMARMSNPVKDRKFRKMVESANNEGDCIINVGNGYYRPVPGDPVDEKELQEYLPEHLLYYYIRAVRHQFLLQLQHNLALKTEGYDVMHSLEYDQSHALTVLISP